MPRQMSKSKKLALGLVSLLLLAVIGYLVYTNFLTTTQVSTNLSDKKIQAISITKIEPNFADDFLQKSPYIDLKTHLLGPVNVDNLGKQNPF